MFLVIAPVLGYLGSITEDRVNIELYMRLQENQDKSLVLAGPVWRELLQDTFSIFAIFQCAFSWTYCILTAAAVMNQFDLCLNPHHQRIYSFYRPHEFVSILHLKARCEVASAGWRNFQTCGTGNKF